MKRIILFKLLMLGSSFAQAQTTRRCGGQNIANCIETDRTQMGFLGELSIIPALMQSAKWAALNVPIVAGIFVGMFAVFFVLREKYKLAGLFTIGASALIGFDIYISGITGQ